MTRLLNVVQNEEITEFDLKRRQIPFELVDMPKMIVTFDDIISCLACEMQSRSSVQNIPSQKAEPEYFDFLQNFNKAYSIKKKNLSVSLDDLLAQLSQTASCISCRSSAEKLLRQLIPRKTGFMSLALDPIQIESNGSISVKPSLFKAHCLYTLFYIDSSKLDSELEINKKPSSKRCQLHMIETQKQTKQKRIDDWQNVWNSLESDECRKQMTIIDCDQLLHTINQYLKRNKFCSDCKFKVLVAFKILTNEAEIVDDDGTYKPCMFNGIAFCTEMDKKPHLHIKPCKNFIASLIAKAESEIKELRPERHAKSIDVAQEEILICIGLHLYERFFQLGQSLKIAEQAWKILFYSSVVALKKRLSFDLNQFKNLDSLCAELEIMDAKTKKKKEKKETKKKNKSLQQKHTCTYGDKSTKLNLSDPISPTSSPDCSDSPKCESKAKKNLELNQECNCDDQTQFVHSIEETNDKDCEMSCCFDIIEYWNKLVQEELEGSEWNTILKGKKKKTFDLNIDKSLMITDEEKQEYFKNKAFYLDERMNRRELLKNRFKMFKLSSNFKLEPRQKFIN